MSVRLVSKSATNLINGRSFRVYKDTEWQEYQVEFYVNNEYQENATYATDSLDDAKSTANAWHSGAI